MSLPIQPELPPLQLDAHGVCRVAGTRVSLDTLVSAFRLGATPEEIHQDYPSVTLADVYATVSYYLKHRPEVDAYLEEIAKRAGEIRREMQSRFPMTEMRGRLVARRKPVTS